jgi:hypothetical protein
MSAAPSHVGCADPIASSVTTGGGNDCVSALLARVHPLETLLQTHTLQAECDAANIKLQAERIAALEAALATRGEACRGAYADRAHVRR